jgi:hypothetical protein
MSEFLKIVEFGMTAHYAFSKVHKAVYQGKLDCPGHIMHGKPIAKEVDTPKRAGKFGKPDVLWYIPEKGTPSFKTFEELRQHYNLPNFKPKNESPQL